MGAPDGAQQQPVACSLTLAAAACRPGDTVTALLQVSCSHPEAVELQVRGAARVLSPCWPQRAFQLERAAVGGRPAAPAANRSLHPPLLPRPLLSLTPQEIEVEFVGIERVDASWVLPAYRRSTPPINSDKRKVRPGAPVCCCCPVLGLCWAPDCAVRMLLARCPVAHLGSQLTASAALLLPMPQVQRYVVQSRLQAATQGTFSDLSLRRFVVR